MDRRLYYCDPWMHKETVVNNERFDICVSPGITGNSTGTIIQYHGIVLICKKVARIGLLNRNITQEEAISLLECFEEKLRETIRSIVSWSADVLDTDVIKVWYYEEDESNITKSDKRIYPPLRFAVTAINVNPLNNSESHRLQELLEKAIIDWLNIAVG